MDVKKLLKKHNLPETIIGTCPIQDLQKNKLSFFERPKFAKYVKPNKGSIVLVKTDLKKYVEKIPGNKYIFISNPINVFLEIHNMFFQNERSFKDSDMKSTIGKNSDIHPSVFIGGNVKIGNNVFIGAHVCIGNNVSIGDNSRIFPNSTIYDKVKIGNNCRFESGVVIGAQGYQRLYDKNGRPHQMIHIGGVKIGDRVELGANTTVDRGTFMDTIIEDDVKTDNHNHIAHNDVIKKNTRLAASIVIGGSTIVGENVWIGVGAVLSDNIVIGDNAEIRMGAVVASSVASNSKVAGFYAIDNNSWMMFMKNTYKDYVLNKGKK